MTLDAVSSQVLSGLINTFVPAVLLAAGVWLLLTGIPKLNASTRYAAWWAVLAALLCLPLLQWSPRAESSWEAAPSMTQEMPASAEPMQPIETEVTPKRVPLSQELRQSFTLPVRLPSGKVSLILAALWAAGTLAALVRLLLSYLDLRGILRRARPLDPAVLAYWTERFKVRRPVQLLASEEIGSPLAAGFLRPAVLVPESLLSRLDQDLADHVVIHELAHLGRRDDWANLAGRLLEAVFWFHPVARWILRRLEFERELACDDWVVAATPSRKKYAASLTRLAELRMDTSTHSLAATMVGRGSQVGRRVRSLLDPRRNAALGVSRGVLVLAMTLIGGLLLFGAQTPGLVEFADEVEAPWPPVAPLAPMAPAAPHAPHPAMAPHPPLAPLAPLAPTALLAMAGEPAPPQAPAAAKAPASPQAPAPPPPPPSGDGSSFLAALAQAGYRDLDVDQIIELKTQGVSAEFIRQMNAAGFGKLTTRQLVEIRIHGVSPTYLAELKSAGISGYTLDQAKELKIHGVRPAEVAAIHAMGFGPYNAREVTEFAIHGVREDFFRALKDNGVTGLSQRDIVEARIHGVTGRNLKEAQQYGNTKDIRRIIKLKQAGVL